MYRLLCIPCLLGLMLANEGCKKDADIPLEVRPSDSYVRCNVQHPKGQNDTLSWRGGQRIKNDSLFPLDIKIFPSDFYAIHADSTKHIWGGLRYELFGWGFALGLQRDTKVTDPLTPPEWKKSELESLLTPGRRFPIGEGQGKAQVIINRLQPALSLSSLEMASSGEVVVETVEDYGSPEANIPYYAKKVQLKFNGTFEKNGQRYTVTDGTGVLIFKYYNY